MKLCSLISVGAVLSLLISAAPVIAALPTVNTFTVAATAVSPVPVTAFTASDSDGTVVGYMINTSSSKPAASDPRWTATPWTSYSTTSIGTTTLYAWAKDNANGVSNSRIPATTNVVGAHSHDNVYVNENQSNSISTMMIVDAAVTTAKIADGAVTDATISWPISGAKISGTVPDADTVDGKHASELASAVHPHDQNDVVGLVNVLVGKADQEHAHSAAEIVAGTLGVDRLGVYAGVKVVHKGASDGVNSFNTITEALTSITDASESNPYVVLVMPGTYSEAVELKNYVSLKGSGPGATKIVTDQTPVITGANNATISGIYAESYNYGQKTVLALDGTNTVVRDCVFRAISGFQSWGINIIGGTPLLESITVFYGATDQAIGIYVQGDSMATIRNSTVVSEIYGSAPRVLVGINIGATGPVTIDGSIIRASEMSNTRAAVLGSSAGSSRVSSSLLEGGATQGVKLVNCFDENYDPIQNQ